MFVRQGEGKEEEEKKIQNGKKKIFIKNFLAYEIPYEIM